MINRIFFHYILVLVVVCIYENNWFSYINFVSCSFAELLSLLVVDFELIFKDLRYTLMPLKKRDVFDSQTK